MSKNLFKNVAALYQFAVVCGRQVGYFETQEETAEAAQALMVQGKQVKSFSRAFWEKMNAK